VTTEPQLRVLETGHTSACHFAEDVSEKTVDQVVATQSVLETAVADLA
jgi:hypothetical protein